jgi:hypothetical protein
MIDVGDALVRTGHPNHHGGRIRKLSKTPFAFAQDSFRLSPLSDFRRRFFHTLHGVPQIGYDALIGQEDEADRQEGHLD